MRFEHFFAPSLIALGIVAACSSAGGTDGETSPGGDGGQAGAGGSSSGGTGGVATSAGGSSPGAGGASGGTGAKGGMGGGAGSGGSSTGPCGICMDLAFTPCDASGKAGDPIICPVACTKGIGCTACVAGQNVCVGNEIHACDAGGTPGSLVSTCDVDKGETCSAGLCQKACDIVAGQPSNIGCEFWSVDLDQQDLMNDPASAPYGVVLANTGMLTANVTVEINTSPPGSPVTTKVFGQISVLPGQLQEINLGSRELDCGLKPNDYAAPGTCLSSQAFRITSSSPIVIYQFNTLKNSFSNDASLLLPTNALGKAYRVINWSAGHPTPIKLGNMQPVVDRSYVTIVGTEANTQVKVRPSWRIKGNPPVAATAPGGEIIVTLGPFDVLNLETDDATLAEAMQPRVADLTGTTVESSAPVAVFSGVESTAAPYGQTIPTYPGWANDTCCLDHLEEQLFPLESVGKAYVVTRSPVRSTGSYKEPDILRFVGAAAPATVTTNLPAPFDSFTLNPGEVKDTWTDQDIVVTSTEPVLVGQILVSQGYVDGDLTGDPSLTVFASVEQYRKQYLFLTPSSWTSNYLVIAAVKGTSVTIDGAPADASTCLVSDAGIIAGNMYESRRCKVGEGAHKLLGDNGFGIVAYGYGSAGSYAAFGGADVARIYTVPPLELLSVAERC